MEKTLQEFLSKMGRLSETLAQECYAATVCPPPHEVVNRLLAERDAAQGALAIAQQRIGELTAELSQARKDVASLTPRAKLAIEIADKLAPISLHGSGLFDELNEMTSRYRQYVEPWAKPANSCPTCGQTRTP